MYDTSYLNIQHMGAINEHFVIAVFPDHTNTPASNLGYLAPPPGQFFMGAKLFIGTPWMGNKGVLKKILVWAMWNCMVSMPTHSEFEKGGLPIKLLISQLLLILDY